MRAACTELHSGQYGDVEELRASVGGRHKPRSGERGGGVDADSRREERAQNLANDIARAKLHLSRISVTRCAGVLDSGLPEALMADWAPRRSFDPEVIGRGRVGRRWEAIAILGPQVPQPMVPRAFTVRTMS